MLQRISALTLRERLLQSSMASYPDEMGTGGDTLAAISAACVAFAELGSVSALIGGVAVGIRSGVPRATLDVDFAVRSTISRADVIEHLRARGFELVGEFAHTINFRHTSGEPLQVAFDPRFDPMIDRCEVLVLSGIGVPVVTREDLITMKKLAAADPGRRRSKALRDQADIALLEGDVPGPDEGW